MTIEIHNPETEALIRQRQERGGFRDAEEAILDALRSSEGSNADPADRTAAIERLRTFGRKHGLSLGEMTIRELRDESRP